MKYVILILLLVGGTFSPLAQPARLFGSVTTQPGDEPAVGARVMTTSYIGTTTDAEGNYELSLAPGTYLIVYSLTGFAPDTIPITLAAGESRELNHVLEEVSTELDIVVVSAGKFEQKIGDVTVSMEVIQPRLLQNKNTISLETILQQTPGISIVDDEPQIRSGSGYSFGAGSRVQVLIDDMPYLSGDAGKPSWGFLPVENAAQVEVIKGASSVLYGSSALSGVINLRSAFPKAEPMTRVTAFYGIYSDPQSDSAKYWDNNAMVSGINFLHSQQAGSWDLVFGGNFLGDMGALGPLVDSTGAITVSEGYNPFEASRYNAQSRARLNANLRYRFPNTPGLSAGVNTNWSKSDSYATLMWENSTTGLYKAFDGAATFTRQTQGYVSPFIIYFSPSGYRHSLKTRWQSLDNNNDNNQGNFSDVYYGEYQFQARLDSLGLNATTLTTGLVGQHTDARGELFTGDRAAGNNIAENAAAYVQVDKKFLQRLNVSVGMRYEYFKLNDENESRPVFRGGLSYTLHEGTYLRASYGQGYRFPSMAEKFIITDVGALRIFPNNDIRSESSYNLEVGVKQGFKAGNVLGFLDVAVFQQEFDNFIEFTFGQWEVPQALTIEALQRSLGFKSVNTGSARVRGVDLSVIGQGKAGEVELQFLAGYTYTKPVSTTPDEVYAMSPVPESHPLSAENFDTLTYARTSSDATGNILKYRMQHLVRADVEATWKKWMCGVSVRTNSHMQNIDLIFEQLETYYADVFNTGLQDWRQRHTTGDYVIDARVAVKVGKYQRLSLIVNNVLNREYAIRPLAIEDPRLTMLQYTLTL
ncbi:MAG: TonB-dependent receptor [Flavobacteriales bacterium]|nr:TonB-dependent receptor [Flavobacteriales bacterium]